MTMDYHDTYVRSEAQLEATITTLVQIVNTLRPESLPALPTHFDAVQLAMLVAAEHPKVEPHFRGHTEKVKAERAAAREEKRKKQEIVNAAPGLVTGLSHTIGSTTLPLSNATLNAKANGLAGRKLPEIDFGKYVALSGHVDHSEPNFDAMSAEEKVAYAKSDLARKRAGRWSDRIH